jgi:hypothetical protein
MGLPCENNVRYDWVVAEVHVHLAFAHEVELFLDLIEAKVRLLRAARLRCWSTSSNVL